MKEEMNEDKKVKKSENKIVPFRVTDEMLEDAKMDQFLKESLMKEADELEAELNADPALTGVGASDDMFQSIVNRLKEEGSWEDDEPEQTAERDIYDMLSEEDREALELGRETRQRLQSRAKRRKSRRRVFKVVGIAAAAMVVLFGVSMSSEANRRFVQNVIGMIAANFNFQTSVNNFDEETLVYSKSKEEIAAMRDIQEKTGISGIDFVYFPEGMKYYNYHIMEDCTEAIIKYQYNNYYFSVNMINLEHKGSSYYMTDQKNRLMETAFINNQGCEAKIWRINLKSEEETYVTEVTHNEVLYILNGKISLEELKKIINSAIFL